MQNSLVATVQESSEEYAAADQIQVWYRYHARRFKRMKSNQEDGDVLVADCIQYREPNTVHEIDEDTLLLRFLSAVGLRDQFPRFQLERVNFSDLQLLTLNELEEIGFPLIRNQLSLTEICIV